MPKFEERPLQWMDVLDGLRDILTRCTTVKLGH